MDIRDLAGIVLALGLVAIICAVVLVILAGLGATSVVTTTANASINAFITAIGSIGTNWAGLLVLVIVAAILIGLVVRSFAGAMMGGGQR